MQYLLGLVVLVLLYVALSSSFNLYLGYGGLFSIAHAAFFGVGAYTSALLSMDAGVPVPLAMLAATAACAVVSLGVALPALRVSGDYLLVASLGFLLGMQQVMTNLTITGSAAGLSNIPPLAFGAFNLTYGAGYLLPAAFVAALAVALGRWVTHSPYGLALRALRQNEAALASLGRDPMQLKVSVFALGCAVAGLAGALYAHYFQYVSPDQFGMSASVAMLTMVIVGGAGTSWGPVLGAAVLELMPQALSFFNLPPAVGAPIKSMLFNALVLLFIFLRPEGLIGRRPRAAAAAAPPEAAAAASGLDAAGGGMA
jgi:branched-chain amino acid transport system permease protein